MREIPLTQGYVVRVDDEDYERINEHKWFVKFGGRGGPPYAARTEHWRDENRKWHSRTIRLHRELMNFPPDKDVDHDDSDTMNCSKSNLKILTREENLAKRYGKGRQNENVGAANTNGEAISDVPF